MFKRVINNHLFWAGILLFILTVTMTYPLFFHSNAYIPGFFSTDETFGLLSNWWWLKFSDLHHLDPSNCNYIATPIGMHVGQSLYPIWTLLNTTLSKLTDIIFTYNFNILLSFMLSGLFMYLLSFYITRNKIISFISAIIYNFCPYHFVRSWQHLGLSQIQFLPLYLLSLFLVFDNPNKKRILFAAICLFFVSSFDFYYSYFMYTVTIIFILFTLIQKKLNHKLKITKNLIIVLILSAFLTGIGILPNIKTTVTGIKSSTTSAWSVKKPFEDLFSQSARPLSYLLPATTHPIFGKFTENFVGSTLYGESFTEHTLYLGWIPLILAFVAVRRWRKNKQDRQVTPSTALRAGKSPEQVKENFYIGFFIFLAIVAWLFSQPPWWQIGPVKVYMPSFFMYKVLPMYRAYCRFGIVLMLAVAVLAGFGLKFVLERFKTRKTKIAIATLFCGLVLFEFWNWPPYKVIDVSKAPGVYSWLKNQPGDIVIAEYPLDADTPNEMYKFYQTKHEKKIVNGTIPGTHANKVAQTIVNIAEPETASKLKWMGVKYVLVHQQEYLNTELTENKEELNKIPKNKGLKFVKTFPPQECTDKNIMCVQKTGAIDVFEVVAAPVPLKKE